MRVALSFLSLLLMLGMHAKQLTDYNKYWNNEPQRWQSSTQRSTTQSETQTYTLTVACANYNKQQYTSTGWRLYGGEIPRTGSCVPNFKGYAKSLTPGKYCFIATFFKRNMPGTAMSVVAKTIEINGDTTIVLDPEKTDKDIVFRAIYPDKSEPVLPVMGEDFWETGEMDYSKANSKEVFWTISIDNDEFGHVANFGGSMSVQSEDSIATLDKCGVSITELGRDWHISMTRYMENLKNEYYITHSSINGTSQDPPINKPDYIEYVHKFADNPIKEVGNKGIPYEVILHNTINGYLNTAAASECYVENPRIFLSEPIGEDTQVFTSNYAVELKKNDAVLEPEAFWYEKYGIISPPIIWDNESNALAYGVSGGDSDSFVYWQGSGHIGPTVMPGNPYFALPVLGQENALGESAPIAVTAILDKRMSDKTVVGPCIQWLGIYSEVRQSDVLWSDVDVKCGANQLTCKASELSDTLQYMGMNNMMNGECEITYRNERNIKVGEIVGFNKTSLLIKDVRGTDINPPTATMMQFRNSKNEVTNMFNSSEGSIIEITGGDFFEIMNNWNCIKPDIKVEYALENSEEYNDIIMDVIESNFILPSFGYFWRGKLDNIKKKGGYKIRVTMKDSDGNSQEQTIYPAFIIKEGVGIAEIENEVETEVKYYNLQGNSVKEPQKGSIVIRKIGERVDKIIY